MTARSRSSDRLVFDLDGGSDGGEICLFAVVIFVLHCGHFGMAEFVPIGARADAGTGTVTLAGSADAAL